MSSLPVSSLDLGQASARIERLRADTLNFEALALILKDAAGIHLVSSPKNLSLMAARLSRVLQKHGLKDYGAYLRLLRSGDAHVLQEFISAMTTNTTEFFRESRHFQWLTQALPAMIRDRQAAAPELRIWCAAASSGQEVYSLAMTLLEMDPDLADGKLKILATDIDLEILERASCGVYTQSEMSSVPTHLRHKYFRQDKHATDKTYCIHSEVRKLVTFAPFNLMDAAYPFKQPFDIVFCRNVLIYFDRATACAVTEKIAGCLRPSGWLFVGHSEVGLVRSSTFETLSSAVYRRIKR